MTVPFEGISAAAAAHGITLAHTLASVLFLYGGDIMKIIEKLLFNIFLIAIFSVSILFNTTAGAAEQTIQLRDGFNFAAVTVTPDSATQAIMTANPSIKEIYLYSAAAGNFLSAAAGDFSSLAPGRGYIIISKGAAVLKLQGTEITQAGDIKLKAGFNLSGFSKTIVPIKFSELISANPAVKGIYKWSAAAGGFVQVLRVNGLPAAIDGADPEIISGQSYFINMAADAILNYDSGSIKITAGGTEPQPPITPSPLSLALSITEISVEQGGVYDLSRIKAAVKYSDGSTREVSAVYTCDSGAIFGNLYQAPASPGTASITASYTEGSSALKCVLKLNIIEKPLDIADYFPLRREDLYYYSNGQDVIDYRITGEYYAAGVLATKFASTNGTYDHYRLDETGLYYCDTAADRPTKLCNKNPKLNESCFSYVKNSLGQAVYTSTLLLRDAYSVHGGLFDDVLVIENKMTMNGVTSSMYFFFARGVGLIRYATSLMQFEFAGGLVGGRSYAPVKKKWTFLIYSCGDNDRGDISPTLINEIKGYRNTDIENDANIVVQLSPSKSYYSNIYNSEFYNITASRYYLKDGVFYRNYSRTGVHTNNGDPNDIYGFLNWGATVFPAEHYAIFISAHGSGIISWTGFSAAGPKRSIAYDDHPYNYLSAAEYKNVFSSIKNKIGKKIDIITFDSCVMGMLEVAYQLRDCADHFVASEAVALERDTAMFSQKFMALADKSPLAVSKAIVDSYIGSAKLAGKSLTMSAVDLAKVSAMGGFISSVASMWLSKSMNESEIAAFVNAIYKSQRFGPAPYNESAATMLYDFSTSYIDVFDFAAQLSLNSGAGDLKNYADSILNYKNTLITHSRATGIYYPRAAGLTIFIPKFSTQWYNSDMTSNYIREQYMYLTDFGSSTMWGSFLDDWSGFLYRSGW